MRIMQLPSAGPAAGFDQTGRMSSHPWMRASLRAEGTHEKSLKQTRATLRCRHPSHTLGSAIRNLEGPMSGPNDDDRLVAGVGEAVFSGLSVTALWTLLLRKRLISADEAVMAMDAVILALEQAQEGSAAGSPAIEYARARAQHLMDTILEEAPTTPFGPA